NCRSSCATARARKWPASTPRSPSCEPAWPRWRRSGRRTRRSRWRARSNFRALAPLAGRGTSRSSERKPQRDEVGERSLVHRVPAVVEVLDPPVQLVADVEADGANRREVAQAGSEAVADVAELDLGLVVDVAGVDEQRAADRAGDWEA